MMSDNQKQQLLADVGARRRLTRDERMDQIFEAMMSIQFAIPLRDIARITGLKKTWHLRSMVDELVREGSLIETAQQEHNGLYPTRMFHINPDLR